MINILLELNFRQRNGTRLCTCILGFLLFIIFKQNTKAILLLGAVWALMLRNPKFVYAMAMTIPRDTIAGIRFLRLNFRLMILERKGWSLARIFQHTYRQYPQKVCFIMDDRRMTYEQIEEYTNKIGSYFKAKGLQRGDCVCLLMDSRPEYPCIWLGLSKIGVVTALVNSNLRKDSLLHSLKIVNPKCVIVGTELIEALKEVLKDEEIKQLPLYQFSDESQRDNDNLTLMAGATDLTAELRQHQPSDLSMDIKACKPKDKLLYVYTSGTTGLPKAAIINNLRYLFMTSGSYYILNIQPSDIVYNPLPLYHTAGGIVAVGSALLYGCTMVMRKKFSASNFWKDCIKYNCTIAQYIGELCRYLLATPQKPEDTQHNLRMMYGNGLRPQIWSHFASRFNIPFIGELYGSTEGNSNLANTTNRVGAIGFLPLAARPLLPVHIIRVNEESGEPVRDAKGFCVRCEPGETGLLVGKVDPKRAVTAFNGYSDRQATDKKLLFNAFRKGDVFFNSGDMVVSDILGYVYFKDRTGDTFRWRGENVATLEVEATITNVVGLKDCVVYGVDIPHIEGKAGMAAIVDPDHRVDMQHLSYGIRGSLPSYAQPLFVRLMKEIPQTATFKMKKRDLMAEGFDIGHIKDPVYYLNKDGLYRRLTQEQFDDLLNGRAGL